MHSSNTTIGAQPQLLPHLKKEIECDLFDLTFSKSNALAFKTLVAPKLQQLCDIKKCEYLESINCALDYSFRDKERVGFEFRQELLGHILANSGEFEEIKLTLRPIFVHPRAGAHYYEIVKQKYALTVEEKLFVLARAIEGKNTLLVKQVALEVVNAPKSPTLEVLWKMLGSFLIDNFYYDPKTYSPACPGLADDSQAWPQLFARSMSEISPETKEQELMPIINIFASLWSQVGHSRMNEQKFLDLNSTSLELSELLESLKSVESLNTLSETKSLESFSLKALNAIALVDMPTLSKLKERPHIRDLCPIECTAFMEKPPEILHLLSSWQRQVETKIKQSPESARARLEQRASQELSELVKTAIQAQKLTALETLLHWMHSAPLADKTTRAFSSLALRTPSLSSAYATSFNCLLCTLLENSKSENITTLEFILSLSKIPKIDKVLLTRHSIVNILQSKNESLQSHFQLLDKNQLISIDKELAQYILTYASVLQSNKAHNFSSFLSHFLPTWIEKIPLPTLALLDIESYLLEPKYKDLLRSRQHSYQLDQHIEARAAQEAKNKQFKL